MQTGGDNLNIIPGSASFAIDLRALHHPDMHFHPEALEIGSAFLARTLRNYAK